jgi:hypothetical protein
MTTALVVTTIVSVTLALCGYSVTYLNNLRIHQRQERLLRINRQLSEFYGPIYALSQASTNIYWRFQKRVDRPGFDWLAPYLSPQGPNEHDVKEWQLWALTYFMPNNRRIMELIVSKSDLLIEESIPRVLLQFCEHTAGYEIVLKKWEKGDDSEYLSVVEHPGDAFGAYFERSFQALKAEQARLVRHVSPHARMLRQRGDEAGTRSSLARPEGAPE